MRNYILIAVLLCLVASPVFAQNNIPVVNGSFEQNVLTVNEVQYATVPGWTLSGANYYQVANGYEGPVDPVGGNQYLCAYGANTFIGQTGVQYQAGHTYVLSVQGNMGGGYGYYQLMASATASGAVGSLVAKTGYDQSNYHDATVDSYGNVWLNDTPWKTISTAPFTVVAASPLVGQYIRPEINVLGSGWTCYDNVIVTDVSTPEPGSLFALGMGMMSLAGIAIRRRK